MPRPLLTLLTAALAVWAEGCFPEEVPADVPELGALSRPSVVTGRDGGFSLSIGGRTLWVFNDTLMTAYGVDGFSYRSATAAWGDGTLTTSASLDLDDTLDPNGAPYQLIPYTAAEIAANRAGGPNERFAMWPGSVTSDGAGGALIMYRYLKVHPGFLHWDILGSGVARLTAGSTVAVRDPQLLFASPQPPFSTGAVVVDGWLHLYACETPTCQLARAPLGDVSVREVWQTWDGAGWSSDFSTSAEVLRAVPGELSVSFNDHLGSFLAVHSVPLSNEVVFHTAPRPEGPWSPARHLFVGRHADSPDARDINYAAKEHPQFARDGGRTLVVGYANPAEAFGGAIRLALVPLPGAQP